MSNFRVGQKVVCIIDATSWHTVGTHEIKPGPHPDRGEIYLITSMGYTFFGIELGLAGFALKYVAHGFRPLVERKTDISVFQKLLDKINQGDRELAR